MSVYVPLEIRQTKSPISFALTNFKTKLMLTFMRKLLCCLILAFFSSVQLATAQSDVLPPVVRNLTGEVTPVAVVSSNERVQALVSKAFSIHGAYVLAAQGKSDFTFSIEPTGANSVSLEILSGSPAQSLYKQQVSGKSLNDAALRAADLAVAKTSGLKGFFAGRIAFVGRRGSSTDLYEGDLFFQEVRQLTHDKVQCVRPCFSPDGKTILYTSYFRNGFPDIYKIDLASGKRDVFLSFNGVNTGPTYSPNGAQVAMILSGTGNSELYTIGSDCKNMVRLTKNKSLESDPSWSPDGKTIVLASDNSATGKPQLYIIPAVGGTMKRLPTNISSYCAEPAWNPVEPNIIAFTIAQAGAFEVAIYNISTSESHTVSQGAGDAVEPAWTRDGRHLIYTERNPNHRRLVLLDTKTGRKSYLGSNEWGDASQAGYVYP
jgi:TolB protein